MFESCCQGMNLVVSMQAISKRRYIAFNKIEGTVVFVKNKFNHFEIMIHQHTENV